MENWRFIEKGRRDSSRKRERAVVILSNVCCKCLKKFGFIFKIATGQLRVGLSSAENNKKVFSFYWI